MTALRSRRTNAILFTAALLWFLFTAGLTVLRYRLNYSSAYDFGIFSQMYYYLDKCLQPFTTCERDGLLSHFAVHLSPIYYLLLPFYKLVPRPETLLVLQALLVAGGLIPLCLLARALGLGERAVLAFGLVYCLYPAFLGGCFYDFHENKFLTVLILWSLYFLETKRLRAMSACLVLLLLVKEDAPVYAACIGLYVLFGKRRFAFGGLVFLVSCLYFCFAVWYLNRFGDGAMVNRFDNLISDKEFGLVSIFKTILVDPALVLSQIFARDKLLFLMQMLLPLGLLPLMSRRWPRWILLIPFVLINLMSSYKYQHSVLHQYTFGSGALLFYLALINFASLRTGAYRRQARALLAFSLAAGLLLTAAVAAKKWNYTALYARHKTEAAQARELLAKIPPQASVKSSTFFIPALSQRDEIYLLKSDHHASYVVVDLRLGYEKSPNLQVEAWNDRGYQTVGIVERYVAVLKEEAPLPPQSPLPPA